MNRFLSLFLTALLLIHFSCNNDSRIMHEVNLLDKENKIVLVGEPFGKEKLTQLYKKSVSSLKEEYAHELTEQ